MAQFQPALDFVLNNEDSQRTYAIVPDTGGEAIAGVNSHAWPQDYAEIAAAPQGQRGPLVAQFYQVNFWDTMRLGGLQSQDVANRVMDEGVNAGEYTACRMLQSTANSLGTNLAVDGILGPVSLEAINTLDQERLLAAYKQARLQRYTDIVAENPPDAQYLPAWKTRALA